MMLTNDQYDRLQKHKQNLKEELKQTLSCFLSKYPELEFSSISIIDGGIGGVRINVDTYFSRLGEMVREDSIWDKSL